MADDVIHYADEILVATSGTLSQHLQVVDKVLKRIKDGKIKIRQQNINLANEEIEFLEIVWIKGKLLIPRAKTLAFQNLPSPNTPKKANSVTCALSYYIKFVPCFAQLSQPIMDLSLLHPKEFKWTENMNIFLYKPMHPHFAEQENFFKKMEKEMNF